MTKARAAYYPLVRLVVALGVATLTFVSTPARADAYAWSVSSGRWTASVMLTGFNEGAGEGGWDESSAGEQAAWAKRFNAVIPPRDRVDIVYDDASDQDTTLTIHDGRTTEVVTMEGAPDFDVAISIVAAYFHAAVPQASPVTLYTVQVMAARSRDRAESYSQSLDARGIAAEGSFYDEKCLPCSIPRTRIEEGADGFHRVISGVFDRESRADEAAATLRRAGVAAWARPL